MTDKNIYLQILGRNIKSLRLQHGWSQEELADRVGYDSSTKKSTISKIENGQSDLPLSKLKAFAEVFGVSCSDLCEESTQDKVVCDLIEQCYGQEANTVVHEFLKLDAIDRVKIMERISTLLDDDKYSLKKESKNA